MILKYTGYLFISILIYSIFSCSDDKLLSSEEIEWLKQNDSIKISVFNNHPPYQFIDEQGEIDGVFIDYIELIEEKINYKFQKKHYTNWTNALNNAKQNVNEIVIEIQPTKDRKKHFNFYANLFESRHVIVARKNDFSSTKLSGYYKKKVVVPEDFAIEEILSTKHPKLNLVNEKIELECLIALNSGKYDAYIGPKAVANYFIKTKELNNLVIVSETPYVYKPGISVNKNNKILNHIISKATSSITRQEKQLIIDNWLFNMVTPYYLKLKFWVFSLLGIGILLFSIIVFNRYLKSKIKKHTLELRLAKEAAEESNKLKTNFIHNISHEIRTPMNGILGFSQLLQNENIDSKKRKKYTNTIIDSGKQLVSIIDDILEVSKLQANQVKVHLEPTNLEHVFENLIAIFEIEAKKKNLSLELTKKIPNEKNSIVTDKSKLIKTLSSLIDNAIKFTSEGYVKIGYEIKNDMLEITIHDTGIGMKSNEQEIIFNSFSQLEREISRNYSGLGLGLTLAKENINLMQGQLTFVSEVNKGSTFIISVPYNPIDDKEKNNLNNEATQKISKEDLKMHHILIAEDVEVNFMLLKTILERMKDYELTIHRANNGKEAVTICTNNSNIDLVFMDIRMPVMDGYEATRIIKGLRPSLPVIAHTAYSAEEEIQKSKEIGFNDFMSKPLDLKILKSLVNKYISTLKN